MLPGGPGPLIVAVIFMGLALGGARPPWAWTAVAVLLWAAAGPYPPELRRLPGWKLWAAWLAWTLLSALLSAEPLRGLASFAVTATGVLVLALAATRLDEEDAGLWFHLLCGAGLAIGAAAILLPVPGYPGVGILFPYYNYTAALQAAVFTACLGAWDGVQGGAPPYRGAYEDCVAPRCGDPPRPRAPANADPERRRHGPPATDVPIPGWRPRAGLLGPLMAFSLGVIVWQRSRGALLAVAAATVLWLWRRGYRRSLLAAALVLMGLAATAPIPVLAPLLKLDKAAAYTRPRIWKAAISIAADHPVLGEGPAQFERGFLRHNFPSTLWNQPTRFRMRTAHAHSELLQIAAETGLPGLALFLLALAVTLRGGLSTSARRSWSSEAALYAFVALFAHTVVENTLALPALGWLHFSALGIAAGARGHAPTQAAGEPPRLLRAACLAGLVLASLAWWPGWAARSWRGRAFAAPASEGIRWMERALRIAPNASDLWADLARLHLRRRPPAPLKALEALSEAERRNPTEALYPMMGGEILRGARRWSAVLMLADRAIGLEPRFRQARLLRIEALHQLGRTQEASREMGGFEADKLCTLGRDRDRLTDNMLILCHDPARLQEVRNLTGVKR